MVHLHSKEIKNKRITTNLMEIAGQIVRSIGGKNKDMHFIADGLAVLVKLPNGEEIEMIIRPEEYAHEF